MGESDIGQESMANPPAEEVNSCVNGMTREQFIKALVRKSVIAGTLLTAVSAVNKFEVQPAHAGTVTVSSGVS